MSKKHPLFIKAKEKVSHSQKKLNSALKNLEQSRKADEAHQVDFNLLFHNVTNNKVISFLFNSLTLKSLKMK